MKENTVIDTACPPNAQIDAWIVALYAAGRIADLALATHLLECPRCRQQAAMGWALLPDPAYATMQVVPKPDLSFLPHRAQSHDPRKR